jgi:sugar (pentulose or hexulose) kinase
MLAACGREASRPAEGSDVRDLVIGIDVGTTTVKSAAFELPELDAPIAVRKRPSITASPRPDWSETDPVAVEAAVLATVRELVAEIGAHRVAAVGISGTACGAWLSDHAGAPVRPAILWNDGRAADITKAWARDGQMDRIFAVSGNVPFPGYTLSVVAWLAAHEPEALERASSLLWCKDWLRSRLTGVRATDESEASYVPFDITARTWSEELFELTGVQPWRRLFPELLSPRATLPLTDDGARETGLPKGTPIAVGATDIIAGLVGAGATPNGGNVTILGTSANSTVVAAEPPWEPRNVGIMAASPLGRYARSLINTSGSATLDWGARLLAGGDLDRLFGLASEAPEGSDGLVLVPYLSPAGTVSPRLDPNATGTLAGLRTHHGPAHVARAVVEGLACAVADCYANMAVPVAEIVAVGGAARSDMLLQALADIAARPVVRLAGDEFGARGVAVLAAWAIDASADLDALSCAVRRERRFEPRPDGPYGGALERYQALAGAAGLPRQAVARPA